MTNLPPESLKNKLADAGQSHLLKWWDEISFDEQRSLVTQLQQVDWKLIASLVESHVLTESTSTTTVDRKISPPTKLERCNNANQMSSQWVAASRVGEELLRGGKVGAMVVAGGQGSRLGFEHPKGMFPIGPISGHSLFQLHFEQLEAYSRKYGISIPYFIMTSEATDDATRDFLEENEYFGYSLHDVYIFKQGWLPAVGPDGKVLLETKASLAASPDGHGGAIKALKNGGLIDIMRERGIEHLYYHQVDNPTAVICDPVFLGLHQKYGSEMSTKVVAKTHAGEKMGVVVDVNGATQIIEYSDLSKEQQEATAANGQLLLWAGNTAIHAISLTLLERLTDGGGKLPYHRAHKKVAHVSDDGVDVEPVEPNAFKFEQFIFDALPEAQNALVVETDRKVEFNPVKNAEGSDSPITAKAAILENGRAWCEEAGLALDPTARVEISPLYGPTAADFRKAHKPTGRIKGDVYLRPDDLVF